MDCCHSWNVSLMLGCLARVSAPGGLVVLLLKNSMFMEARTVGDGRGG